MIRDTPDGCEFDVRVIPRARRTEPPLLRDDVIVVRLAAPPVEGAANEALVESIAEWLGVRRSAVRIVSGQRSRHKRIAAARVSSDQIRSALNRR